MNISRTSDDFKRITSLFGISLIRIQSVYSQHNKTIVASFVATKFYFKPTKKSY